MQLRQGSFQGDRPSCPSDCRLCQGKARLHKHGKYPRYQSFLSQALLWIVRFLCRRCGHTFSVLPQDRLPYRLSRVPTLEQEFDARATPGKPEPSLGVAEKQALNRAWTQWQKRMAAMVLLLGQMLRPLPKTAARLWVAMRRQHSAEEWLGLLSQKFRTSLLREYRCLHGWWEYG